MMKTQNPDRPHILFLFSDTGGGHRSATEAIIEAIKMEYNGCISTEMVDIFRDYAPRPLKYLPEIYPKIVRVPQAWGLGYRLSNGHRRARLITGSAWPYVQKSIRSLVQQHPSDLIVSMHPLANAPVLKALGASRHTPFITVVTDLVTTHALWYHHQADLCIVPSEAAGMRAEKFGLKKEQIEIVGLPVADRFCHPKGNSERLRANLGWPLDKTIILLVGGGEGMGPLEKTARAIANAQLDAALVVIAGRNQALKSRLEAASWPLPVFIYGFVHEMPDFMQAADILLTKAGPGTISEALNAGLPMILYSRLPGQEDGNVTFVVSENAGVWAPRTDQIVTALRDWLDHPEKRMLAASNARRIANPMAARQIAQILGKTVGVEPSYSNNMMDESFTESVSQ